MTKAKTLSTTTPKGARRTSVWRQIFANWAAVFSLIILIILAVSALLAPQIAGPDPMFINPVDRFKSPAAEHLFGTDNLGRDVFKIVLYGGRTSLWVGFAVTLISMTVATVLALISGFFAPVDLVLMRIVDGMMAFPGVVLATAVAGFLGPSVITVIFALSIVLIAPSLRIVRGQVLVIRELQMIEAARSVGVPIRRILSTYILPSVTSPILVQASFIFSAAVLGEAALSFIGLGIGPNDVSWGSALTEARNYIDRAPWIIMFPGLALMLTIFSLNLLGDALRDILDPRLARSK